ncbi:MAG TPA: hypothetical protein VF257_05960 [Solirubrobacteraceae bacterium]
MKARGLRVDGSRMADSDGFESREKEILSLVARLRADADISALLALLRTDEDGPERVRDALAVLAELDPELIVQVALDALIAGHLGAPATAEQTRRVLRDPTDGPDPRG